MNEWEPLLWKVVIAGALDREKRGCPTVNDEILLAGYRMALEELHRSRAVGEFQSAGPGSSEATN